MRVIEIAGPGGPDVLRLTERPIPVPGPGEVLIAVEAAGVNRPDILQRRNRYPPPPGASDLPGLEVAGTIAALGPNVSEWTEGARVCALLAGGGYAEYCIVPAVQCLPIPAGLSMVEAAALPETFLPVWHNVFERGRLQPGESFLVHGGASGIGTAAIQIAAAKGSRVWTTTGSAAKCEVCERLGAERALNYREVDWESVFRELTGRGMDVILDFVGGDYIPRNVRLLAEGGRLVQIGFLRGPRAEIDMGEVMRRGLTLTGSLLRPRTVAEKGRIAAAVREQVWPLVESGRVRPVIDSTFPLAEAAAAHRRLESGEHIGKIVLVVRR